MSLEWLEISLFAVAFALALLWNVLIVTATRRARSEDPDVFAALRRPTFVPRTRLLFRFLYSGNFPRPSSSSLALHRAVLRVLPPAISVLLALWLYLITAV